jgi:sucrose-6F-phosphate phosphohydrolase
MRPPHIRLFSTDLDGTLLGHPEATARFGEKWAALPPHRRPLLVYNTSRTVAATRAAIARRGLPEPEFIIGSVGTELHDSLYNRGAEFGAQFGQAWDAARVEEVVAATPGVRPQPAEFCHALKSSWFWSRARREELEALERRLKSAGLAAVVNYSCRYFLDVVPACGGKGQALAWLCRRLSIACRDVLVAGDSGNDNSMFLLPEVNGIVVSNALPELSVAIADRRTFLARQPMADGVLEGLVHFGVLPDASPGARAAVMARAERLHSVSQREPLPLPLT